MILSIGNNKYNLVRINCNRFFVHQEFPYIDFISRVEETREVEGKSITVFSYEAIIINRETFAYKLIIQE